MIDATPIHSLLSQQQQHLKVLLSLLQTELNAIAERNIEQL